MGTLTWELSDPALGNLERIGLAGLFMALQEAERLSHDLGAINWELDPTSVTLTWPEDVDDKEALVPLIDWAWQAIPVTGEEDEGNAEEGFGVFWFPAIHSGDQANLVGRLDVHSGILWTFLQHPRIQPKTKARSATIQMGDKRHIQATYVQPRDKMYYSGTFQANFFLGGCLRTTVKLKSFLVPGTAPRHKGEEAWEGSTHQAILLFFAPTVCYYAKIHGQDWQVVVPDVRDLELYSRVRRRLTLDQRQLYAASATDAGLRILVGLQTAALAEQVERRQGSSFQCEVFGIGKVKWNKQQQVRNSVLRLRPKELDLSRYEIIERALPNQIRLQKKQEFYFVTAPVLRGCIANQLLKGHKWYTDLFEIHRDNADEAKRLAKGESSPQRAWFRSIRKYHQQAMRTIMEQMNQLTPDDIDEAFVEVVHHTMRRLFAREAGNASRGTRSVGERQSDLVERIRRNVSKAQTRLLLREVLSRLFAEAGGGAALHANRREIWQFINDHQTWRRARDLTLLSLVTYPSPTQEPNEQEA